MKSSFDVDFELFRVNGIIRTKGNPDLPEWWRICEMDVKETGNLVGIVDGAISLVEEVRLEISLGLYRTTNYNEQSYFEIPLLGSPGLFQVGNRYYYLLTWSFYSPPAHGIIRFIREPGKDEDETARTSGMRSGQ